MNSFGRGHYEEQICEIYVNLDQKSRCYLTIFLFLGDHARGRLGRSARPFLSALRPRQAVWREKSRREIYGFFFIPSLFQYSPILC